MAISKEKKGEILRDIQNIFQKAQSAVFVNFHGLTVGETTDLRKKLKESDVNYVVAKKTLIKKALDDAKLKGEMPQMDGELAVAYSLNDLIAPARDVYSFQKTFKDRLSILGGIFEGKYMDKGEMTTIASIPPMQILRGQFLNVINSPIQGLVVVLDKIAEKKV